MNVPLGSVTALIFCRSGCGSLVACSVDLIVVVFCALVGCSTSSGVKHLSVCRGGAGSGGCCRPVGEVAIGLSGSGRELDVDVDGSRGGDVVRCCFVAGSTTMSSVRSSVLRSLSLTIVVACPTVLQIVGCKCSVVAPKVCRKLCLVVRGRI